MICFGPIQLNDAFHQLYFFGEPCEQPKNIKVSSRHFFSNCFRSTAACSSGVFSFLGFLDLICPVSRSNRGASSFRPASCLLISFLAALSLTRPPTETLDYAWFEQAIAIGMQVCQVAPVSVRFPELESSMISFRTLNILALAHEGACDALPRINPFGKTTAIPGLWVRDSFLPSTRQDVWHYVSKLVNIKLKLIDQIDVVKSPFMSSLMNSLDSFERP